METTSTCGYCDYKPNGYVVRCHDPAPYRAEFRIPDGTGPDHDVLVCVRHAHDARTHDSLKRIYSARDDHHGTDD